MTAWRAEVSSAAAAAAAASSSIVDSVTWVSARLKFSKASALH
jgi:hypothetical protein